MQVSDRGVPAIFCGSPAGFASHSRGRCARQTDLRAVIASDHSSLGLFDACPCRQARKHASVHAGRRWTNQKGGNRGVLRCGRVVTVVGSIALEVRKAIYLLLPLGQGTVEKVAAHLRLSVRTVQRQLGLANTSFSRLTEGVRYELVARFMSNPRYPIGRVSGLVGYSHQATFTNWFVRRFGMTPRNWRNRQTRWLC